LLKSKVFLRFRRLLFAAKHKKLMGKQDRACGEFYCFLLADAVSLNMKSFVADI
jgi:hypothetical protein